MPEETLKHTKPERKKWWSRMKVIGVDRKWSENVTLKKYLDHKDATQGNVWQRNCETFYTGENFVRTLVKIYTYMEKFRCLIEKCKSTEMMALFKVVLSLEDKVWWKSKSMNVHWTTGSHFMPAGSSKIWQEFVTFYFFFFSDYSLNCPCTIWYLKMLSNYNYWNISKG